MRDEQGWGFRGNVVAACVLLLAGCGWAADGVDTNDLRRRVEAAPAHPRLLWLAGGEAAVRAKLEGDPRLKLAHAGIVAEADKILGEAPVVYRKDGRRLLGRSREALERLTVLAYVVRMGGDERYVRRAVAEMQAAAAMPDWNPSHFLDTAEMTLALAIGYDWLYARLAPAERDVVRKAIVEKGLTPYLGAKSRPGWERGGNNWNQVCHAGMTAGALALIEDDPARAVEVAARALAGVPYAMKVYVPDGTYPEGPGYWNYGTLFNVVLIELLQTALGTDGGLAQREGFLRTGDFILQMTGPTRLWFPFSDCGRQAGSSMAMFWFAARTQRPELLWFENPLLDGKLMALREQRGNWSPSRLFPLVFVWAAPGAERAEPSDLHWLGRGPNPLAVHRTSWSDPKAVYLAIKAGSPGASHGHMDVGSFVLDADGVRWALDLGSQDYNAMEQRGLNIWDNRPGSDRWRIFRYHNRAHNTLMVDGMEQVVQSYAPIVVSSGGAGIGETTVDLSATYRGQLGGAVRRFRLQADRRVVIEDRLRGGATNHVVRWALVTPGRARLEGRRAWLEADGQRLRVEVASPTNAVLRVYPADPPPSEFDERNPGVSILGFESPIAAGAAADWRVILTPGSAWKADAVP